MGMADQIVGLKEDSFNLVNNVVEHLLNYRIFPTNECADVLQQLKILNGIISY